MLDNDTTKNTLIQVYISHMNKSGGLHIILLETYFTKLPESEITGENATL